MHCAMHRRLIKNDYQADWVKPQIQSQRNRLPLPIAGFISDDSLSLMTAMLADIFHMFSRCWLRSTGVHEPVESIKCMNCQALLSMSVLVWYCKARVRVTLFMPETLTEEGEINTQNTHRKGKTHAAQPPFHPWP